MWLAVRFKLLKPLAFGVYNREMVCLHFNITDLVLGLRTRQVNNALDSPWSILHVLHALSVYGKPVKTSVYLLEF